MTMVEPDPGLANHLRANMPGDVIIVLATIDASAELHRTVSAYHLLVTYRRPLTWFVVAGPPGDWDAVAALQRMVNELGLHRAWVLVDPSPAEVVALRQRADLVFEV